MRNGTPLLLLATLTLAACACLWALGSDASAASLEPTDSGAPSAIMMFPVGEKPNPGAAAMAPVAFNHVIHEKWMERAGKDCMVCHHTGDPVACVTCHTVQGSEKGNFITLYDAMHTVKIKARKENTPSSCVSCHAEALTQRNCAGCHETLVRGARDKDAWCAVCHAPVPNMTREQLDAGLSGKLSQSQNEKLATEVALGRQPRKYWSPMLAPYKVDIDTLKGQYEACAFNHRHHVQSMLDRIADSKLADAFHTEPGTVCMACHHNTPPTATPPKCVSCHSPEIDRANPAMPRLMAAFHLECMSCHTDMQVARPRNTDCTTCHKLSPLQAAANQGE